MEIKTILERLYQIADARTYIGMEAGIRLLIIDLKELEKQE